MGRRLPRFIFLLTLSASGCQDVTPTVTALSSVAAPAPAPAPLASAPLGRVLPLSWMSTSLTGNYVLVGRLSFRDYARVSAGSGYLLKGSSNLGY